MRAQTHATRRTICGQSSGYSEPADFADEDGAVPYWQPVTGQERGLVEIRERVRLLGIGCAVVLYVLDIAIAVGLVADLIPESAAKPAAAILWAPSLVTSLAWRFYFGGRDRTA